MEHRYDPKATYNLTNRLLFWNEALPLPSSVNDQSLANDFSTFFCDKITKIMKALEQTSPEQIDTSYIETVFQIDLWLDSFKKVTSGYVFNLMKSSPSKLRYEVQPREIM